MPLSASSASADVSSACSRCAFSAASAFSMSWFAATTERLAAAVVTDAITDTAVVVTIKTIAAAVAVASAGLRRHHRQACSARADAPGQDRPVVEEPPQVVGQLAGRLVAVGRVAGDRLEDDRLQVARDARVDLPRRRAASSCDHLVDQLRRSCPRERRPQRRAARRASAQAVDVAARRPTGRRNRSGAMYRSVPTMSPVRGQVGAPRRAWPGRSR